MVTKKQMIRTELEEIVELCEAAIEIKQLPYANIGQIQAKAERALKY